MSIVGFKEDLLASLKGCEFELSNFKNGDFGDLQRVEVQGFNKLGTVEFWSLGWVGIDLVDCVSGTQEMSLLLSPDQRDLVGGELRRFAALMTGAKI
ncbi:hypothetical protein [Xanthomonas campestris]|uniref:hypothetical protein n=1 Tax=Xanthomonas campestris TaxID=339 RepID=UPI002368C08F|nr:hypothetical protein [Xanthomonas campestris]WDI95414.1 hypothetical protein JH280_09375 [Xanthomonas campestris]